MTNSNYLISSSRFCFQGIIIVKATFCSDVQVDDRINGVYLASSMFKITVTSYLEASSIMFSGDWKLIVLVYVGAEAIS